MRIRGIVGFMRRASAQEAIHGVGRCFLFTSGRKGFHWPASRGGQRITGDTHESWTRDAKNVYTLTGFCVINLGLTVIFDD